MDPRKTPLRARDIVDANEFDIVIGPNGPEFVKLSKRHSNEEWESNFGKKHGGRAVALIGFAVSMATAVLLGGAILVKTKLSDTHVSNSTLAFLVAIMLISFAIVFLYLRFRVALVMNLLVISSVSLAYGLLMFAH